MESITINSGDYTDAQFLEIKNLIEKYNNENANPMMMAAKIFLKKLGKETSDDAKDIVDAFIEGAIWQRDLLSKDDYEKIIYIIMSSLVTSGQSDSMIKDAMKFVQKACTVFNVDLSKIYEQGVF